MGTADIESPISVESISKMQAADVRKKKELKRSPTPRHSTPAGRDASSQTPTRTGRSLTPFSLYLIRHNPDAAEPPKWRSITPFIDRSTKEKTPFELGKDLKAQMIAHKMVFDRASVMDITDESNYEPARYITSDAAVIDRASVMDISNVEVVYLIEEYDETALPTAAEDEELQSKEKKKSKRIKKAARPNSTEKSDSIEKDDDGPSGNNEKKSAKSKKKIEKKKTVKNESDEEDDTREPSPPKLSLKLELGGGPKINKKLFENKIEQSAETKPPVKKNKQEVKATNNKTEATAKTPEESENKITKKKKKSITSLGNEDATSIEEGDAKPKKKKKSITSLGSTGKKSKSRTGSIATSPPSRSDSISSGNSSQEQSKSENASLNGDEQQINPDAAAPDSIEDNKSESKEAVKEIVEVEIRPRTPTPPRRSPSPAYPPKLAESYYAKVKKQFGENFSNQIRMFSSIKREKPHHPAFIVKLKDLCATETDTIRINCAIHGPNTQYRWLKDGIILKPNDRVRFIEEENILSLQILNSRAHDTADYTLKVFNDFKSIECTSYVNVAELGGYQDEPCPAQIESIDDYFHFIDDKLMIECKVTGSPRPRLTWYKEDRQLHEWMTEYTFMEEAHGRYVLIVNHPTEHDIGVYTLRVENDRGSHTRKHCVQFLARRPTTSSRLGGRAYRFLC